jgi:tetratricopeptide (TPR) repeat protein/tRNA A-37 threonylcarbamoyl transferase component Bud32
MNHSVLPSADPARLSTLLRVDDACRAFEAAWRAGGLPPALEPFQADTSEPHLSVLLRELLALDVAYRRRRGERPAEEDYRSRFADHVAIVHSVFAGALASDTSPSYGPAPGGRPTPRPGEDSGSSTIPPTRAPEPDGERAALLPETAPRPEGGRYRVVRFHAQGGLGQVSLAVEEDLNREVALKEIQPQFADEPRNRHRFLLEAEITSRLEHPGIVPVYGLGHYDNGRPYYAMRFIKGDSLRHALDRFHQVVVDGRPRVLELRQLLGRFLDACNAVAYAHSRGVLHRDLKPDNIMLGSYGETLVVDWGLAKAQHVHEMHEETEDTLKPRAEDGAAPTLMGSLVGTPTYMSPEQAARRSDALGTARDVYGLGATLYHLLTGRPPVEGDDVEDVLDRVRRGEVPRPRQGNRAVPPALEAVCQKAMALKPEERYPTVRALGGDIERWLADEPVSAYREPLPTRAARWTRRHRTLAAGAVTLLVTAVAALAVSTVLISRARDLEYKAKIASIEAAGKAKDAEARAVAEKTNAVAAADTANQVSEFLASLFQVSDPVGLSGYAYRAGNEQSQSITAREILDRGARLTARELKDRPAVRAKLLDTIGHVYRSLGDYAKAEPLLNEALALRIQRLGTDHVDVAATRHNLAWLYYDKGDFDRAEPLFRQALEVRRQRLGKQHSQTATTMLILAWLLTQQGDFAEAERLFHEVIDIRRRQEGGSRDVAVAQLGLVAMLLDQGRFLETGPLLAEVLPRIASQEGLQNLPMAIVYFQGGVAASQAGLHPAAISRLQRCLQISRRLLGPGDNPYIALILHEYATALERAGDLDGGEARFRECLDMARRTVGYGHPRFVVGVDHLGELLARRGKFQDAERLYQDFVEGRRKLVGPDHVLVADALSAYGRYVAERDDFAKAERLLRDSLAIYRKSNPARCRFFPDTLTRLGDVLVDLKKYAEARTLLDESLAFCRARPDRPMEMVFALHQGGRLHLVLGENAGAEACYRGALALARKLYGEGGSTVTQLVQDVADTLADRQDYSVAVPLFRQAAGDLGRRSATIRGLARAQRDLALARLGAGTKRAIATPAPRWCGSLVPPPRQTPSRWSCGRHA